MGKIANMLYMIDLLNTGNIYTLKELSEKIGVTERMIRYYKDEICNNGIAIESFKGPNGGYFMIDEIKNYTSINKYDIPYIVIAPQCHKNNFCDYHLRDVEKVLEVEYKRFEFDKNNIFVLGSSMGAYGAWNYLIQRHELSQ